MNIKMCKYGMLFLNKTATMQLSLLQIKANIQTKLYQNVYYGTLVTIRKALIVTFISLKLYTLCNNKPGQQNRTWYFYAIS